MFALVLISLLIANAFLSALDGDFLKVTFWVATIYLVTRIEKAVG